MQYTPQQMMGYKGYNSKCRIGNWYEDIELEEARMKEFLKIRQQGLLSTSIIKNKMQLHLREEKLTNRHEDGFIHFGDVIMLYNEQTRGFLSTDLDDVANQGTPNEGFNVSTAPSTRPALRNVFVIERAPVEDDPTLLIPPEEKDILHYGQKFCISTLPGFHKQNLYLYSDTATPTQYSKVSHNNEVTLRSKASFRTTWVAQHIDPSYRMEFEGDPVKAGYPVLLCHCQTNQILSSDTKFITPNDFGNEYEVCLKRNLDSHKLETAHNHWTFVMGEE